MTAPTETPEWEEIHPGIEVGPDVAGRWAIVVCGDHQISFNERGDAVEGAECWWCSQCKVVVHDMSEHVCPLTTEQARSFASTWVEWRDTACVSSALAPTLTAAEREQLFAWVRATMAKGLGSGKVTRRRKLIVAEEIGCMLGWRNDGREPVVGSGEDPDEMEAWFADALALCEAVGWPS